MTAAGRRRTWLSLATALRQSELSSPAPAHKRGGRCALRRLYLSERGVPIRPMPLTTFARRWPENLTGLRPASGRRLESTSALESAHLRPTLFFMIGTSPKRTKKRAVAARGGGALTRKISGRLPALPPSPEEIARRLAPYCQAHGIVRLDLFGSFARGDARPDSDVDLIATFREIPGLHFFGMERELAQLLGRPVDLLLAEDVAEMTNPHRRTTIQRDRRTIYAA